MLKVIGILSVLFDASEVTTNVSVYVPTLRPAGENTIGIEEGVGPGGHDPKSQKTVASSVTFVMFTGVEELLEVKLIVCVILGPFTGELTVIDGGVAIRVTAPPPITVRTTRSPPSVYGLALTSLTLTPEVSDLKVSVAE